MSAESEPMMRPASVSTVLRDGYGRWVHARPPEGLLDEPVREPGEPDRKRDDKREGCPAQVAEGKRDRLPDVEAVADAAKPDERRPGKESRAARCCIADQPCSGESHE